MSLDAKSPALPVSSAAPAGLTRVRRGSLAVLALIVAEYGIGMYVNVYVAVPQSDHGRGVASVIANGPPVLSVHVVISLLLGLGALGVLVQSAIARQLGAIAASAAGLFALAFAAESGASFTSSGHPAESMAMSVFTGLSLLCYAANLYLLRLPGPARAAGSLAAGHGRERTPPS